MSKFLDFFNNGVNKDADSTGNMLNIPSGKHRTYFLEPDTKASDLAGEKGKQRSYFLEPDVYASSMSTTLSGNLKLKGRSKSKDHNDKFYPIGFTPDVDFYQDPNNKDPHTLSPIERGNVLDAGIQADNGTPIYGNLRNTNGILEDVKDASKAFRDMSLYEYVHHLDRGHIPIGVELTNDSDIYLTSFTETDTDNEDPVSFGYDLIIDFDNSPLFNGSIENFINRFSSYKELESRFDLVQKFRDQFFKFFNVDIRNILGYDQPRTYYLQKINGLNDLTESVSSDKLKQFVDYGKDFITLTLREDVSVNTGYLAALYKLLTWSRIHGKKMIPDNLLRFDIEIVVTEARRFNRVIKNSDSTMDQYADQLSRYRYRLYDCQFFFENFSHGNDIDMTNLGYNDNFDIKFNYKFSTVLFEKFSNKTKIGTNVVRPHITLDNSKSNLKEADPKRSNSFTSNGSSFELNPIDYVLNKYTPSGEKTTYNPVSTNKNTDNQDPSKTTRPNIYVKKLDNVFVKNDSKSDYIPKKIQEATLDINAKKIGKAINHRSNLLQRTLKNIESTFKSDVKMLIYNLKKEVQSIIPTNFVGGFTEDGYQYNIPAYYINKTFNTANNTLHKTVGSLKQDIYELKNNAIEGFLYDNITDPLNGAQNLLNKQLNKLNGHNKGGGTKPNDIYGDGSSQPIKYIGSNTSSDDAPLTPPHHKGKRLGDIYGNNNDINPTK